MVLVGDLTCFSDSKSTRMIHGSSFPPSALYCDIHVWLNPPNAQSCKQIHPPTDLLGLGRGAEILQINYKNTNLYSASLTRSSEAVKTTWTSVCCFCVFLTFEPLACKPSQCGAVFSTHVKWGMTWYNSLAMMLQCFHCLWVNVEPRDNKSSLKWLMWTQNKQ